MKKILLFLLISHGAWAQTLGPLTVEKIMRDPKWIGVAPSNLNWSHDSKQLYFNWNPEKNPGDSLHSITLTNRAPQKVAAATRRALPSFGGSFNKTFTKKVYEKNGDLFLLDVVTGKINQITNTIDRESGATFSLDERKIIFTASNNLFSWEIATGAFAQLTDFKRGAKRPEAKTGEQEKWLKTDQLAYFDVLKQRSDNRKASEKNRKGDAPGRPKEIYFGDNNITAIQLSPDGNFVTYQVIKSSSAKNTIVPNYVTESGFTEDIPARSKVGGAQSSSELFVYDIKRDTVLLVKTDDVPGIFDNPEFRKDYPAKETKDAKDKKPTPRAVSYSGLVWSADGKNNALSLRSQDNKDRWIVALDVATAKLKVIDRQHDEAWIGGPGTGGGFFWWCKYWLVSR
jgi:hypothetical protein